MPRTKQPSKTPSKPRRTATPAVRRAKNVTTKHGHGLDMSHAEAVLADDPLQADYRVWRQSRKYTAREMAGACVITCLSSVLLTIGLIAVNGGFAG